ncbi:DUF4846 domain-containing protein [Sungkyunkwania multivorans]|uniref:DUF4846 domain-containing protein n=1 Tax=Sungkyunkwania multivorans TaxID=1173618 RepID=A0ABW3CW42_9FLAO
MKKFFILLILFCACKKQAPTLVHSTVDTYTKDIIDPKGKTIEERFSTPDGFLRTTEAEDSFAHYLRRLPLKPHGSEVKYFDGSIKSNRNVYCGVIDMEIGSRDLQQCADAVMRLRGEYLYELKKYDQIHFNFVSDAKPRYYLDYAKENRSYKKFRKYMNYIFAYANTASLLNEMKGVELSDMEIGDVFIQKGRPFGHAVIVVDMAVDPLNGTKLYMLAQSYMPAQETQILVNRNNRDKSPWYELKEGTIFTPEWTFEPSDLRRFKN